MEGIIEATYSLRAFSVCGPELGVLEQVVVMNSWFDGTNSAGEISVMICPKIARSFGSVSRYETCVCLPSKRLGKKRPLWSLVEFFDAKMVYRRKRVEGLACIALHHALDHFEGRLLVDRLSKTAKARLPFFPGWRE